ncbi:major facilitator superfamily domain-containing protein [Echria macrotheca]|uniref:Major facilitator superfamily domain-containing protein n=1 Tax=Echria macrotheca TaxID=438768 RepID=A0AAJ0FDM2_9PEZI|nr:major facilitator superfamily domain-containing protein [Echria macrotheca]
MGLKNADTLPGFEKKPPILEALSHSDTASQVVSNSTSNTTSRSHAQNLPEDQWIKEVSVSLPGVYSLPGSNIFVALPTEIPVPRGAEEVFERKVRTLLAADLSEARKYVEAHSVGSRDPNSYIFQPAVLRMSGRASGGPDGTVKLSPTIWVRCSSEQHESMRKVLQKKCMKWAHTTEFGEIQVADAARLLSGVLGDSQIPASTGMALDGLEDTTLHLEIEDHHANIGSYTGYLCRATVMRGSAILSQSLSRIGGFITVDGSPLGLTSAHSMLAVVWDQLSTLVSKQNQTQDGCSVPENHAGERPENMSTFQADADANGTTASGEGSPADDYSRFNEYCYNSPEATKAKEAKWIKAELGGAANFLGIKAIPVTAGQNNTVSSIILLKDLLRSDFALERYMIFITFPRIASDFHSLSDIAWYISPYYITSCTGNFLWGRLYSIYHVRPVFLLGAVIFAAGVSISGSAPSTIPFVIGRFLTGLGAPALLSGCMSMLLTITPHKKRQAIETVYSMTYGAFGPLAGLLISGILTDFVTWRWCFWLPLPIGFVAIFVIFVYLRVAIPPPERERVAQREQINRLQLPSVFFFLVANILLLLALQWGSADFEWSNYRIIFLFASAGVAMAVFGALQIHYGDKALVVLRLVRQRSIACAILTSLCTGGCQSFILACASIWARVIQNATALRSGAALLPMAFALSAGALLASHITRKINYFVPVMIGSAAISSIAIGLLTSLQVDPGYDTPIGLLALFGFGIGAGQVIPDLIIKTVAEGTDVSIAVNIAFSASELGGAIFVPVGLAIFNTYFRSALQFYGDAVPPLHQDFPSFAISFLLQSAAGPGGGDFEHAERIVENLILQLFNDSLRKGLYVALALSAAALVTALGSKWTRLKKRAEPDLEIQMAPKTTS